jgi:branched-chain amino acid transport system permease protein
MNYLLHIIIFLEIYAILALSLNLLIGFNGILSLGHSAFYGIGAYIVGIFMTKTGNVFISFSLAVLGAVFAGYILAISASRFKGDIFILVTLAFQVVFYSFVYNTITITNGPYGIAGIPPLNFIDFLNNSMLGTVILYGVITGITFIFFKILLKSNFSLSLKAVRDNEIAAIALGKNVKSLRVKSFIISAAFAAIAGGMYATYVSYIDPSSFTIDESILIISMVLIGGSGNFKGPIIGAITLILIPEALRFINISDSIAPNLRLIIYGLMLVLFMKIKPRGLAGKYNIS